MYGDFPAKDTVYTPCIPINVWFWPTLLNNQCLDCIPLHVLAQAVAAHMLCQHEYSPAAAVYPAANPAVVAALAAAAAAAVRPPPAVAAAA